MATIIGSIRRTDCSECEFVLASGVYVTFRLDRSKRTLEHLEEVARTRVHGRVNDVIHMHPAALERVRRAALRAILLHRVAMHLKPAPHLRVVK